MILKETTFGLKVNSWYRQFQFFWIYTTNDSLRSASISWYC